MIPICDENETYVPLIDVVASEDNDLFYDIEALIITNSEALQAFDSLRRFLIANGANVSSVYDIKELVLVAVENSKKQTKITDYFKSV